MNVLGLSCYYHDAAAALIIDGRVIAAAEEERFSRVKHDNGFPRRSIEFCLNFAGIVPDQLDYVVFYEKPGLKLDRVMASFSRRYPRSKDLFAEVFKSWGRGKLWIAETIAANLKIHRKKILFSEHHLSHAASAFYCSPYNEAAVLTLDGVGEWVTTTTGKASGQKIERATSTNFPHSLGLLYTAFTEFLGFEVNDGEYKVMGMAPYGNPIYCEKVRRLFLEISQTTFELDLDYFTFDESLTTSISSKFLELWGEPRKRDEPFFLDGFGESFGSGKDFSESIRTRSRFFADVAASVQRVVEEILLGFSTALKVSTGCDALCMAGGVAYNSVANGKIMQHSNFRNFYIQPAAGDSGAAVGAALAVYYVSGKTRTQASLLDHASLGKGHSSAEISQALTDYGYTAKEETCSDKLIARVSDLLVAGKVIGWSQGRFEFGPRALGHRSILADPRSIGMKEVVNARVKFRELFRPFAPSCLKEHGATLFELPFADAEQLPYRFMLSVVPVKESARQSLQAVTHVDGSARVQFVSADTNEPYHQLIKAFGEKTGIPVLLNTSFNIRGEPIVASPQDAIKTFEWSAIDALVLDNFVIER